MIKTRLQITRGDQAQVLLYAQRSLKDVSAVRFMVKEKRSDSNGMALFTRAFGTGAWLWDALEGRVVVELTPTQTATLDPKKVYVWECEATHPVYGVFTILSGTFIVGRDVAQ